MAKIKRTFYRPHSRVLYTGNLVDPHTGEITRPESMTKQSFVAECDINNIIKSFSVTGMVNHINHQAGQGAYVDLPDSVDFQEALHTVDQARTAFMTLPSKIRDRFGNDPSQFLAFLTDPANLDEARSLGLANPAPQEPTKPATGPTGGDGGSPPSKAPEAP